MFHPYIIQVGSRRPYSSLQRCQVSNGLSNCHALPGRFIGKLASKLLTDGTVHCIAPSLFPFPPPSVSHCLVGNSVGWLLSPSFSPILFLSSPSQLIDLSILSLPPLSPIFYSISSPSRLRLRLPESPRQFWGKLG